MTRAATRRAGALIISALLSGIVVGLPTAAPAFGASDTACDAPVDDQLGSVADNPELIAAVGAATRAGSLVRVRALRTVPDADLDAFVAGLQEACPSWRAPDGTRRSNLLVLAVSADDRKTGLYYGSAYDGALGDQWTRIQADLMNPRFRDGDFGVGLAAGLSEATRLIQQWQHPGGSSGSSASAGSPITVVLAVLAGLVALAAAIVGTVLGVRHVGRRRRLEAARAVARQKAETAYNEASALFVAVDERAHAVADAHAAVMAVASDEDDRRLAADLSAALEDVDAASHRWISAQERWGSGALATEDEVQARASRATLESITKDLLKADALLAVVEDRAVRLSATVRTLPNDVQLARDEIAEANAAVEAATAGGLGVGSHRETLARASAELEQAAAMVDAHRLGEATALIAEIRERAQSVSRDCTELPGRLDVATALLDDAADLAVATRAAEPSVLASLDALVARYGSACLADVEGSVRSASGQLDAVDAAITEAREALSDRSLEGLARAGSCTDTARSGLARVADAVAALTMRGELLLALADQLPERIASMEPAIDRTRQFAATHQGDVSASVVAELDAAEVEVRRLSMTLATEGADLPHLSQEADRIEGDIGAIAASAAGDVRRAEDERKRANAALAKARADLDAAESTLARHGESPASRGSLHQARSSYARAEDSTDIAVIVSLAAEVSAQAARAERSARESSTIADDESAREEGDDGTRSRPDRDGGGGSTDFGSGGGGGGSSTW